MHLADLIMSWLYLNIGIINFFVVHLKALKTNDVLQKGVLTGCLRIAKESIFTGLNNFSTCSILDEISDNRFGFTNKEENYKYY